jgi:hypothetical protein
MSDFTVDADDLRALVQELLDLDVERSCQILAAQRVLAESPQLSAQLTYQVREAEGAVRLRAISRYRELLDALDSSENIGTALANFTKGISKPEPGAI